jgi:DNA-binding transcriptional MerR regulator
MIAHLTAPVSANAHEPVAQPRKPARAFPAVCSTLDLERTLTFTILTMTAALTIQQTAQACGLSVHTLRYYERIGLIKPVARRTNGHRLYRAEDLNWIQFLLRLRATGMPVQKMQRYAELREAGTQLSSLAERKRMLQEHSLAVEADLKALAETLAYLHHKIALYSDMEHELTGKDAKNGKQIRKRLETAEGS